MILKRIYFTIIDTAKPTKLARFYHPLDFDHCNASPPGNLVEMEWLICCRIAGFQKHQQSSAVDTLESESAVNVRFILEVKSTPPFSRRRHICIAFKQHMQVFLLAR